MPCTQGLLDRQKLASVNYLTLYNKYYNFKVFQVTHQTHQTKITLKKDLTLFTCLYSILYLKQDLEEMEDSPLHYFLPRLQFNSRSFYPVPNEAEKFRSASVVQALAVCHIFLSIPQWINCLVLMSAQQWNAIRAYICYCLKGGYL
jgi:hypothetical protein